MDIDYRDHEIRPAAMYLKDRNEWSVTVYIKKQSESCATFKPFSSGNTCKTKEEADELSIKYAKEKINAWL